MSMPLASAPVRELLVMLTVPVSLWTPVTESSPKLMLAVSLPGPAPVIVPLAKVKLTTCVPSMPFRAGFVIVRLVKDGLRVLVSETP